jgi:hypothetical protein
MSSVTIKDKRLALPILNYIGPEGKPYGGFGYILYYKIILKGN